MKGFLQVMNPLLDVIDQKLITHDGYLHNHGRLLDQMIERVNLLGNETYRLTESTYDRLKTVRNELDFYNMTTNRLTSDLDQEIDQLNKTKTIIGNLLDTLSPIIDEYEARQRIVEAERVRAETQYVKRHIERILLTDRFTVDRLLISCVKCWNLTK